ncbi:ubiquitin-conjugating enzyme E2 [Desulfosediminicola ganghwensis]|uniref:ubiquitin-conjugating enzyme E2 n=1 Tax=Desulfosediminicola ganghwensis TaxID=2569540 RepID=UPI0010ABB7B5|nr:ubiquitin-conjugating enzyme E2 [Desulfosediminicola ganghwensis]
MNNSQTHGAYADDYDALKKRLRHYPQITIVSTEKEPPEKYIIEYKLFGYGYNDKGKIEVRRRHRIQIELPFGYPHFPPTVKPLTATYHPDVDEQAVRIADQWQRNQSLADLVIYIADMIRGEIYSSDGTFNQEAARFYGEKEGKLPLAELKYHMDPDKAEKKRSESSFGIVFKRLVLTMGLLATLAGAGVYYHDMMYIRGAENSVKDGRKLMDQRQFSEALEGAERALIKLDRIFMLQLDREEQASRLASFIESTEIREGLAGNIAHNGIYYSFAKADALTEIDSLRTTATSMIATGDLRGALAELDSAILLAEENELETELSELKGLAAETRLKRALGAANERYNEGKWQSAAKYYDEVVTILETDRRVLPENTISTLSKIKKLRLLARVNSLRSEAAAAEQQKKYQQAADRNRSIVVLISRSGFSSDKALSSMQAEARRENARLREQAQVNSGSDYLVENYKDIFTKHYPGLDRDGIRSPKVRYMGRSGGNYVFIMSCIELVKRKATEYRLYYQYDPGNSQWNLYTEKRL